MNSYKASQTIKKEQRRLRIMQSLGIEITSRMLKEAKGRLKKEEVRILDAGCGTGEDFAVLKEFFPKSEITGVDTSPQALEKAKEKQLAVELHEANLLEYKNPQPFDLIFIKSVLMHIPPVEEALNTVKSNLKTGGVIAIFEPDYTGMACGFPKFPAFKGRLVKTMKGYGIDPFLGQKLAAYLARLGYAQIKEFEVNLEISPQDERWEILPALCEVAGPALKEFEAVLEEARQNPQNTLCFKGKMAVVATKQ